MCCPDTTLRRLVTTLHLPESVVDGSSTPVAILDTNVVLDWLVFDDRAMTALSQAIEREAVAWHLDAPSRQELEHVLTHWSRPHWPLSIDRVLGTVDRLGRTGSAAAPSAGFVPALPRCRDTSDQKFVELAVRSRAHWLVTRDAALLALRRKLRPFGITVLRPADWPQVAAQPF